MYGKRVKTYLREGSEKFMLPSLDSQQDEWTGIDETSLERNP